MAHPYELTSWELPDTRWAHPDAENEPPTLPYGPAILDDAAITEDATRYLDAGALRSLRLRPIPFARDVAAGLPPVAEPTRVPHLLMDAEDYAFLDLDENEHTLLGHVDGASSVLTLSYAAGIALDDAVRALSGLAILGVIELR